MASVSWIMILISLGLFGPDAAKAARRLVDPNVRMQQMLNCGDEGRSSRKHWLIDQPSHLTPDRVHGGIGP